MGDSVKVTVIATGFYVAEPIDRDTFFQPVAAQPVPVPQAVEEMLEEEEVVHTTGYMDPDDLDVPAYLRNNNGASKQVM